MFYASINRVLQNKYLANLVSLMCFVRRLRSSAVLVVGLTGLTAELIKNIVLAGIKALTLIDNRNGDANTMYAIQGASFLLLPSERSGNNPVSCDNILD